MLSAAVLALLLLSPVLALAGLFLVELYRAAFGARGPIKRRLRQLEREPRIEWREPAPF